MDSGAWRTGLLGPVAIGVVACAAFGYGFMKGGLRGEGTPLGVVALASALVGFGTFFGVKRWPGIATRGAPDPKRLVLVGAALSAATLSMALIVMSGAGKVPRTALPGAFAGIALASAFTGIRFARLPLGPWQWPSPLAAPCILGAVALVYAPMVFDADDGHPTMLRPDVPDWVERGGGAQEGRLAAPTGAWDSDEEAVGDASHLNVTVTWAVDALDAWGSTPAASVQVREATGDWRALAAVPADTGVSLVLPSGTSHWRLHVEGSQLEERPVSVAWHLALSPDARA